MTGTDSLCRNFSAKFYLLRVFRLDIKADEYHLWNFKRISRLRVMKKLSETVHLLENGCSNEIENLVNFINHLLFYNN